jgi:Holliday junction DNA helicase RuvA
MYDHLEGRLVSARPGRVVLEVGGVGYDVAVPLSASPVVSAGERLKLWTHLIVREDAHLLFGFLEPEARELFRLLLCVRGVGPASALALLSGLTVDALLQAIAGGDKKALTRVKGIGDKTAAQILLDLKDRAPRASEADGHVLTPRDPARTRAFADAVRALVSIGFSEKEARKSVEHAARRVDPDDLEALVRAAIQE